MIGKLKDLMALKSQMSEVKKRLDTMVIKVTSPAGLFEITVSGSQQVQDIKVVGDIKEVENEKLEQDLKDAFNKAVSDSHRMAAQAMGDVAGIGGTPSA
ncbi:MAG: YbaB/EbfC family nucleoid-associated protein [Elusimicrobiaceae bacterium]|jgi:DNA-binding protein YbaB|nr:YbaB/EbfC family nucleoid-associated protein [Elusimicrobiaceae bacterium]MBT3955666.1 YbaB/EbfC family nucleoid-associated protein [Elusimicrobiaceae bacterium]MBT4008280.1 YbaB/EbfC family nucleoid-associated protein [Elusimicrobiaceae bacterium]MBT4402333.1 YbaB/EbfC family nucleoid-associated protein [Elusimicrobiaceae bacterium]MBT4439810.1 YbaB/EbfC family nucleoid-associated protein [Elusimicrobiaceae bacterium]